MVVVVEAVFQQIAIAEKLGQGLSIFFQGGMFRLDKIYEVLQWLA